MPGRDIIGVEGLRAFARALKDAESGLLDELKDTHREVGELVASTARANAPRRSGRLAASIKSARAQSGVVVSAGRKSIPYAKPIHFGWPSRPNRARGWRGGPIRPQPFLYDAVDQRRSEVVRVYAERLEEIAAKIERQAG